MKKFFTIFLSLIFIITFGLSILLTSVQNTLFQADFHKKNIKEINLYQKAGSEIVPMLLLESGDSPMQQLPLSKRDLGELIQKSLPKGWLEQEVEKNIDSIFAYLKNQQADLLVAVNLEPLKTSFSQQFANNLEKKLKQLPPCSAAQMQNLQSGQVEELNCLPPQMAQENATQMLSEQLSGMTENVPNKIDLSEQLTPDVEENLKKIQQGYQLFTYARWGLIAVTSLLFIIILLINKKRITQLLKNISLVLAIIYGICFGALTWASSNIGLVLSGMPSSENPALDTVRNDIINITLSSFLKNLAGTKLAVLAISAGTFIVITIMNKFLAENSPKAETEALQQ